MWAKPRLEKGNRRRTAGTWKKLAATPPGRPIRNGAKKRMENE